MQITTEHNLGAKVAIMYGNRPAWGTINRIIIERPLPGSDFSEFSTKYEIEIKGINEKPVLYQFELFENIEKLKEYIFSPVCILGDESD